MDPSVFLFKVAKLTLTSVCSLEACVPLVPCYRSFYLSFALEENGFLFMVLTLKDVCNFKL